MVEDPVLENPSEAIEGAAVTVTVTVAGEAGGDEVGVAPPDPWAVGAAVATAPRPVRIAAVEGG